MDKQTAKVTIDNGCGLKIIFYFHFRYDNLKKLKEEIKKKITLDFDCEAWVIKEIEIISR